MRKEGPRRIWNMLTGNKTLSAGSKCPGESDLLASIEDRQVSGKTTTTKNPTMELATMTFAGKGRQIRRCDCVNSLGQEWVLAKVTIS